MKTKTPKIKKEKILKQLALQEKVKKLAGINLVNCGNCGSVVLQTLKSSKIDCPYCNIKLDVSDCPDFLYAGMENDLCN